jgi:hypothetical protein
MFLWLRVFFCACVRVRAVCLCHTQRGVIRAACGTCAPCTATRCLSATSPPSITPPPGPYPPGRTTSTTGPLPFLAAASYDGSQLLRALQLLAAGGYRPAAVIPN